MANNISRVYDGYVVSPVANTSFADYNPKGIVNSASLLAKGSTELFGVTVDNYGKIYVSDPIRHVILMATANGSLALFAGQAGVAGNNGASPVSLLNAKFNTPRGLACDAAGNLYVADSGNNQIRKITPDGKVTLLAGDPSGLQGYVNGVAARFKNPWDVAIDASNNIFVADTENHCIRKFVNGTQNVITIAGAKAAGDIVGAGNVARFNTPRSIAVDGSGTCFIADYGNYKVKKMDRDGKVSLVCGAGTKGTTVGTYLTTQFQDMFQLTVDRSSNIYVLDFAEGYGPRLMKVNYNGVAKTVYNFDQSPTSGHHKVIGVEVDRSGKFVVIESEYQGEFYASSNSSLSSQSDSTWSGDSWSSSSSTSGNSGSSFSSASTSSSSTSSDSNESSLSSPSSDSDSSASSVSSASSLST